MAFEIRGVGREGHRTGSRKYAFSAIVLAMRWLEAGFRNVAIRDGSGQSYDVPSFRQRMEIEGSAYRAF